MKKRRGFYPSSGIVAKTNRVLGLVFFCLLGIALRVGYLATTRSDSCREEVARAQRRMVVERAERGTIIDRFGLSLAVNRVQYNAAVRYADLTTIPTVARGPDKTRKYPRREHVARLSGFLATELNLDRERVEDLIYSKASLFPEVPFVLREDIPEPLYYRLKMLERDWPGLTVERVGKRFYPQGKVGADVVGYLGAIGKREYDAFIDEVRSLEGWLEGWELGEEEFFPEGMDSVDEVRRRLEGLRARAYTINDRIGRTGVEEAYEEDLRGNRGTSYYCSDARGHFLRRLPGGGEKRSGQCVRLSLSADLQRFAEELLVRSEEVREGRSVHKDPITQEATPLPQPWIKGGGIVAMDPRSGEVLALASYPRFQPNDFLSGTRPEEVSRWLESDRHLAALWDQQVPLIRERYVAGRVAEEQVILDWNRYLNFVLPSDHPLQEPLGRGMTLSDAVHLQNAVEEMLSLTGSDNPLVLLNRFFVEKEGHKAFRQVSLSRKERDELEEAFNLYGERIQVLKGVLDRYLGDLTHNYDKLLLLDLCRVAVDNRKFSPELLRQVGEQSLADYRRAVVATTGALVEVKEQVKKKFHEEDFRAWRTALQRSFLKEKREEEKRDKRAQRPYLDYLDGEEESQFSEFWDAYGLWFVGYLVTGELPWPIQQHPRLQPYLTALDAMAARLDEVRQLMSPLEEGRLIYQYLASMRPFDQLDRPLYGRYRGLRRAEGVQLEKHLAAAFYPQHGFGFGRSFAYRQGVAQGSLFKLVVAYEALLQLYRRQVEQTPFLASLNPLEMVDQTHRQAGGGRDWNVGYFANGQPIPQQYKGGRIPKSTSRHIGHVDLPRALEWSSNPYFAILAMDHLADPNDLIRAARQFGYGTPSGIPLPGEIGGRVPKDLTGNPTGLYEFSIGQHQFVVSPLQSAVMLSALVNGGHILRPFVRRELEAQERVRWSLPMPKEVASILLEGMERAAKRGQTRSLYVLNRHYQDFPEAVETFASMKGRLIGKSSTTEAVETVNLDWALGTNVYNHIWFGAAFRSDGVTDTYWVENPKGEMELVVVVFLRYGGYGMEAAPLAAQVADKWKKLVREKSQIGCGDSPQFIGALQPIHL